MKSALFVDFDNVYSGLKKLDPAIADRFARQPTQWIEWLTQSLGLPDHSPEGARRRLLVRRCYLNPAVYPQFRAAFNVAGFEIIDCPALTSGGKTSTDIHMVLDIIDLLQHEAHYDEFIVFSADADFTPVLRKLRRWDRRTTVLAIGFPSAAYKASADLLIDSAEFVRDGLGVADDEDAEETHAEPPPPAAPLKGKPDKTAPAASKPSTEDPHAAAEKLIRQIVNTSPSAVVMPALAHKLASGLKEFEGGKWGNGGFKAFIAALKLEPFEVNWDSGGYIRDPRRHAKPTKTNGALATEGWGKAKDLFPIARQVHDATGLPLLTPTEYQALFATIAADVAAHPFQLTETSKRVRDTCRAAGNAVSRADVNFVLQGLLFSGHAFGKGDDSAAALASKSVENALELCKREQMVLDQATTAAMHRWMTGG